MGVGRMIFFSFNAFRIPGENFISWEREGRSVMISLRDSYLESKQRRRNVFAFDENIVHFSSLLTIFVWQP